MELYCSCCKCRGRGRGRGSSREHVPLEISKLNSLKCNFLHLLDWNWITRKVFYGKKKKMFTIKWNIWFGNYNYWFALVCFLVDSKTNSNQKECMNPWWQKVIHRYVQSSCCIESSEKSNKKRFSLSLKKYLFRVQTSGDYLSNNRTLRLASSLKRNLC